MRGKKGKSKIGFTKYLPVLLILLSITIMVGSTFAYFTDRKDTSSDLTFSKVELSSDTTLGIDGVLFDVIPGSRIVDGAVAFSKAIDSEAIYVRAKISFTLPEEYEDDEGMLSIIDALRSATDFNIISTEQNGAVWSEKQGNYFYLMEATSEGTPTNLKRVDTIDTYTLSNEMVIPRSLEQLEDNAQYMKSINFHIAFEAIQADNVSNELEATKETFNAVFPEEEIEEIPIKVVLKGFDLYSNLDVINIEEGQVFNEPEIDIPLDSNNEPMYILDGWYTDSKFNNEYEFGSVVTESITLYPRVYEVSQGLQFYQIVSGGVTTYSVAKGTCTLNQIVIPNTYKGIPVTSIYNGGFSNMTSLESIYLPDTITEIYSSAFSGCTNLNIKLLPSGLTRIEYGAFKKCTNLTLTELPSEIVYIGNYAFEGCTNLALTKLPSKIKTISAYMFQNCKNLNLIELPSGVTSIEAYGFMGCTSLALTELPSGVTSIANQAFWGCSSLALTELPAGLTSVEGLTFSGCTNLALTKLPNGIKTIAGNAFSSCTNLAITELPSSVTEIGSKAFDNCGNIQSNDTVYYLPFESSNNHVVLQAKNTDITTVDWPENVTMIADSAFSRCVNLTLTELPDTITNINKSAFYWCTNLALTSLPSGLTSIAGWSFEDCTNLALTELPSGVTSIGTQAFYKCSNMTLTSLPSELTTLEHGAFRGCTGLAFTSLPNSITTLGNYAFAGCTSLALTSLPNSLISMGNYVFENCTSLAITELPSGVTTIGNSVFSGCTGLKSLILGNNISSLGSSAFSGCTGLKSLILGSNISSIGYNAFNSTGSAYILCPNNTILGYAIRKGSTNVYVVDTATDFSVVTFIDATSGAVNGTYNDGTNYYVRTGEEGSYVYYKKYTT